jgi:uncharacterized protein YndB with AHSA1/START domain
MTPLPLLVCFPLLAQSPEPAHDGLDPLRLEALVPASLADVWRCWSTPEGAQTFFAPHVEIELALHGRLEVWWSPDAPPGQRGAEELRVLAFVPERMLAFEWSAPPQFARARAERTFVVVELEPLEGKGTRVVLHHVGFAEEARKRPELAAEWREVREYFQGAWPTVLAALEQRFRSGPLDWRAFLASQAPAAEGR